MANCQQCGNPLRTLSGEEKASCPHCALSLLWGGEEEEPGFDQPNDYEIEEELGRGGDGTVYLCRDRKVGRKVAIKFVDSLRSTDSEPRLRFRAEIETIASLDHPHIIPVYANGELDGRPFYTMKYVSGGSLARLARSPLPPGTAVAIMRKISSAVQHAHERGVLHRDLKPSNILLGEKSKPYLSDFGLAKRHNHDSALTITGSVMGTPAYMSPEQARGENASLTPASDVFSLGSLFSFILTGEHLFDAESPHLILRQVIEDEPRFPPDFDRDLVAITRKCLEKNPHNRYPNVQAFHDDLRRWENNEPITARHQTLTRQLTRFVKRRAFPLLAGTLLLALLAIILWPKQSSSRQQTERLPESNLDLTARLDQSLDLLRKHEFDRANRLLETTHPDQRNLAWQLTKGLATGDEIPLPKSPAGLEIKSLEPHGDQIIARTPSGQFTIHPNTGAVTPVQPKEIKTSSPWTVSESEEAILLFRPTRSDPLFSFAKKSPLSTETKFSRDHRYLIIRTGEHLEVRDLTSGRLTLSEKMPGLLGFTPCHEKPAFTLFGNFPYLISWNYEAETLARPNTLALPNEHFQRTALGGDGVVHLGNFRATTHLVNLTDGSGALSLHKDGRVRRWPSLKRLPGQNDAFSTGRADSPPAFSNNGRFCFFRNIHGQPELRDLVKNETLLFDFFHSHLAVLNDGRILTLVDQTAQLTCRKIEQTRELTWLWNVATDLPPALDQRVIQSVTSKDENTVAVLFPTGFLYIDIQKQTADFHSSTTIASAIALSPDGSLTAVASGNTTVYHRGSQTFLVLLKSTHDHTHLFFSPDGKDLHIGTSGGTLESYHVATLEEGPFQSRQLFDGPFSALAASDDNSTFLAGGEGALTLRPIDHLERVSLRIPLRSSPASLFLSSDHSLRFTDQSGMIESLNLHSQ